MSVIMFDKKKNTIVHTELSDVLERLYHLEVRVPNEEDVKLYISKYTDDITNYFNKGIDVGIRKIKKILSQVDNKIPLYDVYTENIYLVEPNEIYKKIMTEHERFPSQQVVNGLTKRRDKLGKKINKLTKDIELFEQKMKNKKNLLDVSKGEYQSFQHKKLEVVRKHDKLNMALDFLDSFNLKILYATYVKTMHEHTKEIGQEITSCQRPSFTPQFKELPPYYTRSEIIKIALNIGIIKKESDHIETDEIDKLCQQVIDYDIDKNVLVDHQTHIIKNKMLGLVQYYSLQGSYFMNQYLRGNIMYSYQNKYLESLIKPMWELVKTAPRFNKDYILYRFLQTDTHLSQLSKGDIYTEPGFTSTTRDPFYQGGDDYKFGWILVKIILPAKQQGTALCIETVSYFPKEQEIILAPKTQFKLLSKNDKTVYHHTNQEVGRKITTIYEFEVVGVSRDVVFPVREPINLDQQPIDFLKIQRTDAITIEEKIHQFIHRHVNVMSQFDTVIGDKRVTVISEFYDGTGAYKKFYASSSKNGYSLYSIYKNHLLFIIEIGEVSNEPFMYVNFHVKYSTLDRDNEIGSENFLNFIASVAFYFGIVNVILYADYISCDYVMTLEEGISGVEDSPVRMYGGTYCTDFYDYLKTGVKKYSELNLLGTELSPKFKYYQLDILKNMQPDIIMKKYGSKKTYNKLFYIYDRTFKDYVPEVNNTVANFYIWIVENSCFLTDELIRECVKIPQFATDNPFERDYYTLNAPSYLLNRQMIPFIPENMTESQTNNNSFKTKGVRINRYRVSDEQRTR